jgi:hypothetical protein
MLNYTVTKKALEKIIKESFYYFGDVVSSPLLDSLKLLGFYYATNAAVSINIEDLKTPNFKEDSLAEANNAIEKTSEKWQGGEISEAERFQSIIDSWNYASESLKNRIIDYYENFDPLNNLYIMAYSGARGNMSQVRQLVGMRGLMSDQSGKIIDLPIQRNFREGLSSTDYMVSSYGARKGIVDTALKTADSGYLTRRLIYVAQSVVIRTPDCKTKRGIRIFLEKNPYIDNLIGRTLLYYQKNPLSEKIFLEKSLDLAFLNYLKQEKIQILSIRSSLTCQLMESICQKCYGWDLSKNKLISLGEAIGVIAAQSIGEPGTQLTMRTFHTGGVFTSELLKQIRAPFSGKLIIPKSLKAIPFRTNHGEIVSKIAQESHLYLINWLGEKHKISLPAGSYFYPSLFISLSFPVVKSSKNINETEKEKKKEKSYYSVFVKKGKLIAELSSKSIAAPIKKLKPIYAPMDGEIRFKRLALQPISGSTRSRLKVNYRQGLFYLSSGKICQIPNEAKFIHSIRNISNGTEKVSKNKSLVSLKLLSPYASFVELTNEGIILHNKEKRLDIPYENFLRSFKNFKSQIFPIVKNNQYIDEHTILAYFYLYPEFEEKIYSIRKQYDKDISSYFFITESDIWKVNLDQVNNLLFTPKKNVFLKTGSFLTSIMKSPTSGFLLKKDGFRMIFQRAIPICLTPGSLVNINNGDFVPKRKLVASLITYTQQTQDIVQGLPKIEDLLEARIPKKRAYLSKRAGIVLNIHSDLALKHLETNVYENLNKLYAPFKGYYYSCLVNDSTVIKKKEELRNLNLKTPKTQKEGKNLCQIIEVFQTLPINIKKKIILFDDHFWEFSIIPDYYQFKPRRNQNEQTYVLRNNKSSKDLVTKTGGKRFKENRLCTNRLPIFSYDFFTSTVHKQNELEIYPFYFESIEKDARIFVSTTKGYYLLELLSIIQEYKLPLSAKMIIKKDQYIDLAQPLTEGVINPHEVLSIFCSHHQLKEGTVKGCLTSLTNFQLILLNSIQAIYQSQGVIIDNKHIELIIRQMTNKVLIKQSLYPDLIPGEIIKLSFMNEFAKSIHYINAKNSKTYKKVFAEKVERTDKVENEHKIKLYKKLLTKLEKNINNKIATQIKNKFQKKIEKKITENINEEELLELDENILVLVEKIERLISLNQKLQVADEKMEDFLGLTNKVKPKKKNKKEFNKQEKQNNTQVEKSFFTNQVQESFSSNKYTIPSYEPVLSSITNASLKKNGFLAAAAFQETKGVLTKAAILGNRDWMGGLKESVITGKLIPAGTSFLTPKNQLMDIAYKIIKTQKKKNCSKYLETSIKKVLEKIKLDINLNIEINEEKLREYTIEVLRESIKENILKLLTQLIRKKLEIL